MVTGKDLKIKDLLTPYCKEEYYIELHKCIVVMSILATVFDPLLAKVCELRI